RSLDRGGGRGGGAGAGGLQVGPTDDAGRSGAHGRQVDAPVGRELADERGDDADGAAWGGGLGSSGVTVRGRGGGSSGGRRGSRRRRRRGGQRGRGRGSPTTTAGPTTGRAVARAVADERALGRVLAGL